MYINSTLTETLENFREMVLNCKERVVGIFDKRQVLLEIPNIEEPFSEELKYLYQNYDIDLRLNYCNIGLTCFEQLYEKRGMTYSYKYIYDRKTKKYELDKDWNKGWIVIADMNDDPIVADTGVVGTPIYAAIEAVDYKKIAPSLEIFFKVLTKLLKAEKENNKDGPNASEDFEKHITFYKEVITPYFLKQVEKILDKECLNNLEWFLFT